MEICKKPYAKEQIGGSFNRGTYGSTKAEVALFDFLQI
jgi:hypothetical protein